MLSPSPTKAQKKALLEEAITWVHENPREKLVVAARIFKVHPDTLRIEIKRRTRTPTSTRRNGRKVGSGGQNRVLSEAQNRALRSYCKEQWDWGLGATKAMVFQAIGHLLSQEDPPREPPSWRWFQTWLKANPACLKSVKTKPIARNRVETHSEDDVASWFEKYQTLLKRYKITKPSNIYNMDESGVRVGCPLGDEALVPDDVETEGYIPSPENRKSLTIIETISADGRPPIPPVIICPGRKIMESWIQPYLKGGEVIDQSETGYTNERVAINWLRHFIRHVGAGPNKPWKLLLLDGHISHEAPELVILANKHHIVLMEYPSHLTHVLQPLDVGVFRPWKHYHNQAILLALRSLEFEYSVTSFFRDLSGIREKTMKESTIRNSFRESGIWPVSCKTALKKMRSYSKAQKIENTSTPQLPGKSYFHCEKGLEEWEERIPTLLSSPSRNRFHEWSSETKTHLNKAQLKELEASMIYKRLQESQKSRVRSRKSLNPGGPLTVEDAREKIRVKELKEKNEAIRRAEKAIQDSIRKAQNVLNRQGIDARKAERERKKVVQAMESRREYISIELLTPIRDPTKNPTIEELESLQPHPSLTQALNELRPIPIDPQLFDDDELQLKRQLLGESDDEVEFQLSRQEPRSPSIPNESDDVASESGDSEASIDSVARNADFIRL